MVHNVDASLVLQEGFQAEMLKLENLKDPEKIKTIKENALAILSEIESAGGKQVTPVRKYIEGESQNALKTT